MRSAAFLVQLGLLFFRGRGELDWRNGEGMEERGVAKGGGVCEEKALMVFRLSFCLFMALLLTGRHDSVHTHAHTQPLSVCLCLSVCLSICLSVSP